MCYNSRFGLGFLGFAPAPPAAGPFCISAIICIIGAAASICLTVDMNVSLKRFAARTISFCPTAPSPSGRLAQRVQVLKERCIGQMGARQFRRAYDYLKSVQDADDDALDYDVDDAGLEIGGDAYDEQADAETQAKLLAILGPDKVHLAPLVDQLLFMEESL